MARPLPTIVWIQGAVRPLLRATTVHCKFQNSTLQIPSSVLRFRSSTLNTSCIRKESQVAWQKSVFEDSMLLAGFHWGTAIRQTDWSVRFQQLYEFKEEFGHCLVPRWYFANPQLGTWVMNQCRNYKLYQERKQVPWQRSPFESIGFVWATSKSGWSAWFQQLCGRIRSLPRAKTLPCRHQAREVGIEPALPL